MNALTLKGCRVVAMAYKKINKEEVLMDRVELEKDLIFFNLIVLENKLKPETKETIIEL